MVFGCLRDEPKCSCFDFSHVSICHSRHLPISEIRWHKIHQRVSPEVKSQSRFTDIFVRAFDDSFHAFSWICKKAIQGQNGEKMTEVG